MGRQKMLVSPEHLWGMFEDFKVVCKSDPFIVVDFVGKDATQVNRTKEAPLTMEDFEEYIACQPDMPMSITHYLSNFEGRYEDYIEVCSRIKRAIRADHLRGGMAGIYNPSITQRLNGLVDKTETKVIKEQPLFADEPEED